MIRVKRCCVIVYGSQKASSIDVKRRTPAHRRYWDSQHNLQTSETQNMLLLRVISRMILPVPLLTTVDGCFWLYFLMSSGSISSWTLMSFRV